MDSHDSSTESQCRDPRLDLRGMSRAVIAPGEQKRAGIWSETEALPENVSLRGWLPAESAGIRLPNATRTANEISGD